MAQVQPSSANAPPPATNGQPTPSSSNAQQVAPISWEGDRMFNVYIHDYFRKRGFFKAAKELVQEAEIGNDASPPINARQGFLFEWWSVFWMFFSAKTTGQGPENVMLYFHWIQSQQAQQAERSRQIQAENEQRRNAQLPLTTQPPPPRPMVRPPINGVRPPAMVNGTVPMPQGPGQPSPSGQPMQYPMVPHAPMAPTHQQPPSGPGQPPPQINGIVDPSASHPMNNPQRPPSQQQQTRAGPHGPLSQPQQGAHPPPSHPNTVPHLQASQRQVSRGQHDPMRGQFQSPTMQPAPPPGPGQQGSLASHPHMAGMPSQPGPQQFPQHLGRGPPPQGGQPNHVSPRNPSQTPTQPYQQLMNHSGPMGHQQGPGSRSATPGGHPLTPALASREPPQVQGPAVNEEMSRRFQQQPHQHTAQQPPQAQPQQAQHQPPRAGSQMQEHQELMSMETSMSRIPPVFLAQMKMEAGVGDREIVSLSYEEKSRLNAVFKKTMENYNGTTLPTSTGRNGRPVPNQQPPMSGMPMYSQHAPPGARQPSGPRGQKRGSTSPDDEGGESMPKDQSPPDKKRLRPSPPRGSDVPGGVAPPMSSMTGFPPGHPGNQPGGYPGPNPSQQQGPQNMPMTSMRHHGPGGMPPGQAMTNSGGMNMSMTAGPGMGHTMPPGMAHMNLANQQIMGGHPIPNANPQSQQMQQQMHYRQSMAQQHLVKMPGMGPNPANPGIPNASPSASGDAARAGPGGSGGSGAGNRTLQQGKPGSMMPPPSPAHRTENTNAQKGPGMMPPPSQPGNTPGNASGVPSKEQTAPSPRAPGSSPSMRPASTSGAASNNNQQSGPTASMSQSSTGGPATPASAGGNTNAGNTTAPSPSAILTNRISPSAAMNSLPRPQTSGPEGSTTAANAGQNVPPAPSSSAPPTSGHGASGPPIGNTLFSDFFESMEDQFGLDRLDTAFTESIDTTEFAQWIDMNPLS